MSGDRETAIFAADGGDYPAALVYAVLALVEAQERTAAALELIAGEKGILGVEKIA